jgi:hypothetical protein
MGSSQERQRRHSPSDIAQYGYAKELLLLIGDWYHRPANQVLEWYMRAGSFGNEVMKVLTLPTSFNFTLIPLFQPVPDSILINGAGQFNCSMALPARPLDCLEDGYTKPRLLIDPKLPYRIRVVNTG